MEGRDDLYEVDINSMDDEERRSLYQRLLLQAGPNVGENVTQPFKCVSPEPGYCMKMKDEIGNKIFINVCRSRELPKPKDISEEELEEIMQTDAPMFRIPMSLGEPHAELDNTGNACTAYDVVINTEFFDKVEGSEMFKQFLLMVIFEGVESKFQLVIDRESARILKNKKYLGKSVEQQNIRSSTKPAIVELDSPASPIKSGLIEEIQNQGKEPIFKIIRDPIDGHPEFLVCEVQLDGVESSKSITLDVGEDRILLNTDPVCYHMDVFLPFNISQDDVGSQFNTESKVLTITLPVQPL